MRRFGCLFLVAIALVAGVLAWRQKYGDSASPTGGSLQARLEQAESASELDPTIAKLGTNALPDLIAAAGWQPAKGEEFLARVHDRLPPEVQAHAPFLRHAPPEAVHETALLSLGGLGPEAVPALTVVMARVGETPRVTTAALAALLAIAPEFESTQLAVSQALLSPDPATRDAAALALAASDVVVTNALPPLLLALDRPGGPSVAELQALTALGRMATPALPELIALLDQPTLAPTALRTIAGLGRPAVTALPRLQKMLRSPRSPEVAGALEVIAAIGSAAGPARDEVLALEESEDPLVRVLAAVAAARIEAAPTNALPVLLREIRIRAPGLAATPFVPAHPAFRETSLAPALASVWLLGEFGRPARAALPELLPLLDDPDRWMRVVTAWALWRISGNAAAAIPTLREVLVNAVDPSARTFAAALAVELGPAARPLAPQLAIAATSDLRTRRFATAALRQLAAAKE